MSRFDDDPDDDGRRCRHDRHPEVCWECEHELDEALDALEREEAA